MFVKKFEADSLDEALKLIKSELGPDAIILKTITNKGLKGVLKRKKIEITAAISEQDFKEKSVVDVALGDKKESFYKADSKHLSKMINQYGKTNNAQSRFSKGYGNVGLNKSVKGKKSKVPNSGLDAFLKDSGSKKNKSLSNDEAAFHNEPQIITQNTRSDLNHKYHSTNQKDESLSSSQGFKEQQIELLKFKNQSENLIHNQELKIELLEKKIIELGKYVEQTSQNEPEGVFQLKNLLKTYGINSLFITKLLKSAMFEFSKEDLSNADLLIDFALREMDKVINTQMPHFSNVENKLKSNIIVFISDTSVGQNALVQKVAASNFKSAPFSIIKNHGAITTFTEKVLAIKCDKVNTLGEIIASTRKYVEEGSNVIIDYRTSLDKNETKSFINGLRRSFNNIEVILVTSAIHSEEYNKSILKKYDAIIDGIAMNYIDLCLNFGSIFNIAFEFPKVPFQYFGTGDVVPQNYELATSERILSCILNIE